MKRHVALVLIAGLGLAVLPGCGLRSTAEDAGPGSTAQRVEVAPVTRADMSHSVELPATVTGYEEAALLPRIEGYVDEVLVNIGDQVKDGQLLLRIDVPELLADVERYRQIAIKAEAEVNSREAEVEQARARLAEQDALKKLRTSELARVASLVKGGALQQEKHEEAQFALDAVEATIQRCRADIDTALAHVNSAKAEVGVAKADLAKAEALAEYTNIRAPFDGLITSRMVDAGAFVRPASNKDARPLLEIARVDKVRVIVSVPMEDAGLVDLCDEVVLHSIQALAGERLHGKISRFAKSFHRGSRMMRAEIDLDNAPESQSGSRALKPGDYGKVTLVLDEYAQVPTVPVAALQKVGAKSYVVVLDADNTCSRREVEVLAEEAGRVGIGGDVKIGMNVITKDVAGFKDGQKLAENANLVTTEGD